MSRMINDDGDLGHYFPSHDTSGKKKRIQTPLDPQKSDDELSKERAEATAKERSKALLRDNTRYQVKMERQDLKVRQGAQYQNGKPTVFVTKYIKTNQPKTFVTITPGFFTNKHNPNPYHKPLDPTTPNIAFGETLTSPTKKDQKYTFGQIKKKAGHKAEIKAKAKTYIPMVLDFLECKIGMRNDVLEERMKVEQETQLKIEA